MSQQLQLLQIAKHLASLLNTEIKSSPGQPQLIITALRLLIPDGQDFFQQVEQLPDGLQQWNHIIHFLQNQVFQEGMQFGFENIDTEEIVEVYKVVVQLVQDAMGGEEEEEGHHQIIPPHPIGFLQDEDGQHNNRNVIEYQNNRHNQPNNRNIQVESNKTASGSSQSQQQILPRQPNNDDLNYIKKVKQQQQLKRKQHNDKLVKEKSYSNKKSKMGHGERGEGKVGRVAKQLQGAKNGKGKQSHQSSVGQNNGRKRNKTAKVTVQQHNVSVSRNVQGNKEKRSGDERPKTALKQYKEKPERQMVQKKSMIFQHKQSSRDHPKGETKTKKPQQMVESLQEMMMKSVKQVMKSKLDDGRGKKLQIKSNPLMRDKATTEIMQKAMRTYNYQLKQNNRQQTIKTKQHLTKQVPSSQKSSQNYVKLLKTKQQQLQSTVMNQQLKYYYQLRDKKLNYIKHMHKLIQKLQKQRQLDLHKRQVELDRDQKHKIQEKIQKADCLFQDNMKSIKETYKQEKEKNRIRNDGQGKILAEMQKGMNKNKIEEINLMKSLWEQERMKLDLIEKDQENIKTQLEDIYRRNRV